MGVCLKLSFPMFLACVYFAAMFVLGADAFATVFNDSTLTKLVELRKVRIELVNVEVEPLCFKR